jgi:hypothetical protein
MSVQLDQHINIYMQEYNLKYAFPVRIDWSKDELVKLFKENESKGNLATLRLVVAEHPYLKSLQDKYPWLGEWVDFFTTYPGVGYPIHIDNTVQDRKVVLNFPVINTEKSTTNWYELPDTVEWIQTDPYQAADNKQGVYSSTGKFLKFNAATVIPKPVFSMITTEPVVIETKIPHDVKNRTTSKRVIASWHLNFDSYSQARDSLYGL